MTIRTGNESTQWMGPRAVLLVAAAFAGACGSVAAEDDAGGGDTYDAARPDAGLPDADLPDAAQPDAAPVLHTLTVTPAGGGTGTVTSSPGGIDCGADCSEDYVEGEVVTLTAAADSDSVFIGWSGAGCSGTAPCAVTMTADSEVTATFELIQYQLTVFTDGTGTGTVTSDLAGIDCPGDCMEMYDHGTVVTLTANPGANSTFTGWSGGGCGTDLTCAVTLTAATSVTATFTLDQHPLTVVKAGTGTGTVTSVPGGITCGGDCTEPYDYGTDVVLTAAADPSSTFTGWTGGGCGGGPTCTVSVTAATSVTATFTLNQYDLTVVLEGKATGLVTSSPPGIDCGGDCTEPYDHGTDVTLTASTPCGIFIGWSGGGCTGTDPCVVPVTAATTVTATFEPITYHVDAVGGLDTNDGSSGSPFKTITHALSLTAAGCSVQVAPGLYDVANGETFPLSLPPGVFLLGDEPNKGAGANPTTIHGGSTTGFIGSSIDPSDDSVIAGFTILNDPAAGATFNMNLAVAADRVTIRNNHILDGTTTGIYAWSGSADLVIVDNVITGNSLGVGFINGGFGSRVEGNVITGNSTGVEYDSDGGDMGGGATGSVGGNVLSCNTRNDIWTNTAVIIDAADNFWDHVPPTVTESGSGGIDIRRPLAATVITTGATLAAVPCP